MKTEKIILISYRQRILVRNNTIYYEVWSTDESVREEG